MSQTWNNPFSVDRCLRRLGVSALVAISLSGVVAGPVVQDYQSLSDSLANSREDVRLEHPTDRRRLEERLGRIATVAEIDGGWQIVGRDPSQWIDQLGDLNVQQSITFLKLYVVGDSYRLDIKFGSLDTPSS